ncbi:MAG TPA: cystathionine gamma-synthase [Streptosporangiaceae bacterium]|nr:cystathionine gamma-synthase [Streptosporangiaceae bacterium]
MAQLNATDGFETLAIHAGQEPDQLTGAVVPPIYQVSTYKQDGVLGLRGGTHAGVKSGPGQWIEGYDYSRTANPTRGALEECLAALEGGTRALAFASGMAAEDCLVRTICRPGDTVLIPHDAYGGTYRLFDKVLAGWGLNYHPVPVSDPAAVRAAVAEHQPRLIWVETPTNPLLSIADIGLLAEIAHSAGALLAVDNTFASPYLQQPLAHGADAVVHSTTKYIGGHSDVVGGAIIVPDADLAQRCAFTQNSVGSAAGPFDAWLTLRGVKTLAVRMDRHSDNALAVATMLTSHPKVSAVYYPGLPHHPGHEVAAKQMRRFGGMVSFLHSGGEEAAIEMCGRTRLFTLGESLGGVESLIEHPATMTHASVANSPLAVPPNLVRLSVGIENKDDLIEDIRAALA